MAAPAAASADPAAAQAIVANDAKVTFDEPASAAVTVAPADAAEQPAAAAAAEPVAAPAAAAAAGGGGGSNTLKKKKKKKESEGAGKKMELAKVIAPYEATSKEQLTLTKGQMIMVKKRTETGWWQGEVQGGVSSGGVTG